MYLVQDWGITNYIEAYKKQILQVRLRIDNLSQDTLIFTEHLPVFTIGASKNASSHIIWSQKTCRIRGIQITNTNRGGSVTYHAPGQIIIYPIFSLNNSRNLNKYLRSLEQVIINTLQHIGLEGLRCPGKTGVWIQSRKIASIGIAIKNWVTYHGFALNFDLDLNPFNGIIPCGITANKGTITSIAKELSWLPNKDKIKKILEIEFYNIIKNNYNGTSITKKT